MRKIFSASQSIIFFIVFALAFSALIKNNLFLVADIAHAQAASDLQSKIDQRNADINALDVEIAGYQKQIDSLDTQASSLSATLKSIDLSRKKVEADIQVTQNKIAATNDQIEQLSSDISDKQETIGNDQNIIAQSLALINEKGGMSLPEVFLSSDSLSGAWNSIDSLNTIQAGLVSHIADVKALKSGLETNKAATEKARADLTALGKQLADQRQVVLATAAEKNQLLQDTKQSEAQYQKTLADKQAQEEAFQAEVTDYESQLHLGVKTSDIPPTGTAVLSWPLDKITITQYFGNTPFATANPQIYSGKGHTGVDFAASIGTPVKAALDGVVAGVGNTDLVPGCYSFGKWIMIKHPDGLSTLYAHLSVQGVAKGDTVTTGEIIGYSGNTGYTTGPHLHFGVYATQGVEITTFDTSINCKGAIIPLADFKAYLNPLSYL